MTAVRNLKKVLFPFSVVVLGVCIAGVVLRVVSGIHSDDVH
jgi:hypothetical protein